MGWGPGEAALALRTSPGTIMALEEGDLDEELEGVVIARARRAFEDQGLAIGPPEHERDLPGAQPAPSPA